MGCIYLRIRSKKYIKYCYCKFQHKTISINDCCGCENKMFKENKKIKKTSHKVSQRAKATDIPQRIKDRVFSRDNGKCVICGNEVNVMPNAHYISRNDGGLGIQENIVTLCTEFTENKCHRRYDFGTKDEKLYCKNLIKKYLKSKYPNWDEKNLIFKKTS